MQRSKDHRPLQYGTPGDVGEKESIAKDKRNK